MNNISSAKHRPAAAKNPPVWLWIPCLAIVAGIAARIAIRTSTSLWEDEIIAATQASQNLLGVIVGTLATDIHPPLYFLELHFWSLISHTDAWLIANSVLLGLAAMASLFFVARAFGGTTRALVATAVFAVLPVPVWMSGEVRMYAFLSVLLIWLFYFTHKVFALRTPGTASRIAIILLSLAIIASHAIGFVAIFFFALYAASCLMLRRATPREWLFWLLMFGLTAIFSVPQIARDMVYQADMAPIRNPGDILGWMASIVAGGGFKAVAWLPATGLAVWLAVAIFGAWVSRTRLIALCFLIAPILLSAIVELIDKPLFKTNFFPNLCSPFLALVIADLLLELPLKKSARSLALIGVLAGLLAMAVENRLALNETNAYFRQTADLIDQQKQPGDAVWAPQLDIFWGIAWYMTGPGWGSMTTVGEPWRPQSRWWKISRFLGPKLTEKLQLQPQSQAIVTKDGYAIVTAANSRARVAQARRVWLVTFGPRNDLPADLPSQTLGPLRRSQSFFFPPLLVSLYVSPGLPND